MCALQFDTTSSLIDYLHFVKKNKRTVLLFHMVRVMYRQYIYVHLELCIGPMYTYI